MDEPGLFRKAFNSLGNGKRKIRKGFTPSNSLVSNRTSSQNANHSLREVFDSNAPDITAPATESKLTLGVDKEIPSPNLSLSNRLSKETTPLVKEDQNIDDIKNKSVPLSKLKNAKGVKEVDVSLVTINGDAFYSRNDKVTLCIINDYFVIKRNHEFVPGWIMSRNDITSAYTIKGEGHILLNYHNGNLYLNCTGEFDQFKKDFRSFLDMKYKGEIKHSELEDKREKKAPFSPLNSLKMYGKGSTYLKTRTSTRRQLLLESTSNEKIPISLDEKQNSYSSSAEDDLEGSVDSLEPQIVFDPPLTYKFKDNKVMSITNSDFKCLYNNEWINDSLIDFFLKYQIENAIGNNNFKADEIHVFTTFFYTKLIQTDQYYDNIKRWVSKLDLFKNKFIILPINETLHWYGTIIYGLPELIDMKNYEDGKLPKAEILVYDSLCQEHSGISSPLKQFLVDYAKDKYGVEIAKLQIRIRHCAVPKQKNFNDCGIHVIFNTTKFLEDHESCIRVWKVKTNKHAQKLKFFNTGERELLRKSLREKLVELRDWSITNNGELVNKKDYVESEDDLEIYDAIELNPVRQSSEERGHYDATAATSSHEISKDSSLERETSVSSERCMNEEVKEYSQNKEHDGPERESPEALSNSESSHRSPKSRDKSSSVRISSQMNLDYEADSVMIDASSKDSGLKFNDKETISHAIPIATSKAIGSSGKYKSLEFFKKPNICSTKISVPKIDIPDIMSYKASHRPKQETKNHSKEKSSSQIDKSDNEKHSASSDLEDNGIDPSVALLEKNEIDSALSYLTGDKKAKNDEKLNISVSQLGSVAQLKGLTNEKILVINELFRDKTLSKDQITFVVKFFNSDFNIDYFKVRKKFIDFTIKFNEIGTGDLKTRSKQKLSKANDLIIEDLTNELSLEKTQRDSESLSLTGTRLSVPTATTSDKISSKGFADFDDNDNSHSSLNASLLGKESSLEVIDTEPYQTAMKEVKSESKPEPKKTSRTMLGNKVNYDNSDDEIQPSKKKSQKIYKTSRSKNVSRMVTSRNYFNLSKIGNITTDSEEKDDTFSLDHKLSTSLSNEHRSLSHGFANKIMNGAIEVDALDEKTSSKTEGKYDDTLKFERTKFDLAESGTMIDDAIVPGDHVMNVKYAKAFNENYKDDDISIEEIRNFEREVETQSFDEKHINGKETFLQFGKTNSNFDRRNLHGILTLKQDAKFDIKESLDPGREEFSSQKGSKDRESLRSENRLIIRHNSPIEDLSQLVEVVDISDNEPEVENGTINESTIKPSSSNGKRFHELENFDEKDHNKNLMTLKSRSMGKKHKLDIKQERGAISDNPSINSNRSQSAPENSDGTKKSKKFSNKVQSYLHQNSYFPSGSKKSILRVGKQDTNSGYKSEGGGDSDIELISGFNNKQDKISNSNTGHNYRRDGFIGAQEKGSFSKEGFSTSDMKRYVDEQRNERQSFFRFSKTAQSGSIGQNSESKSDKKRVITPTNENLRGELNVEEAIIAAVNNEKQEAADTENVTSKMQGKGYINITSSSPLTNVSYNSDNSSFDADDIVQVFPSSQQSIIHESKVNESMVQVGPSQEDFGEKKSVSRENDEEVISSDNESTLNAFRSSKEKSVQRQSQLHTFKRSQEPAESHTIGTQKVPTAGSDFIAATPLKKSYPLRGLVHQETLSTSHFPIPNADSGETQSNSFKRKRRIHQNPSTPPAQSQSAPASIITTKGNDNPLKKAKLSSQIELSPETAHTVSTVKSSRKSLS